MPQSDANYKYLGPNVSIKNSLAYVVTMSDLISNLKLNS